MSTIEISIDQYKTIIFALMFTDERISDDDLANQQGMSRQDYESFIEEILCLDPKSSQL